MNYVQFKKDQQNKFDLLPIFYAFSNAQYKKGLEKIGATKDDTIVKIGGGGYIKKNDVKLLDKWDTEYNNTWNELILNDEFLQDAFIYELNNYEYCITYDVDDALSSLSFTIDQINKDARIKNILYKACKQVEKEYNMYL